MIHPNRSINVFFMTVKVFLSETLRRRVELSLFRTNREMTMEAPSQQSLGTGGLEDGLCACFRPQGPGAGAPPASLLRPLHVRCCVSR